MYVLPHVSLLWPKILKEGSQPSYPQGWDCSQGREECNEA